MVQSTPRIIQTMRRPVARVADQARDQRERPAYRLPEAARYLRMPEATLRSWILGRKYPTTSAVKFFWPIIKLPAPRPPVLSFLNLVEAHVLDAIRRDHEVSLKRVRLAVAYLEKHYKSEHPLIEHQFETDGLDLFIDKAGLLINLS